MNNTINHELVTGGIFSRILGPFNGDDKGVRYKVLLFTGLILLCWLPLAIFSFIQLGPTQFYLLFVRDIATHVRFLLAMPLLLAARYMVNSNFNTAINTLYETKIVDEDNMAAFKKILDWLTKWRKSLIVDIIFVIAVYATFYLRETTTVNNSTFYAPWLKMDHSLTIAGWWYVLLSLPLLQLLFYRWFFTLFLWIVFLFKISKINLRLSSLHADGVGGLGFLRYVQLSFLPVAFVFSSIAAAGLNNMLIFSNISIYDFKIPVISILVFTFLLFVLPLLLFIPLLVSIKKKYYLSYGKQAWLCARQYEDDLNTFMKNGESRPDSSWHIDLIGSFEKTSGMNIILVDKTVFLAFVVVVLIPFIPVLAQEVPLKELTISLLSKFLG